MEVDKLEKVQERMTTSDDTTLGIKREEGGKMRVTSRHWENPKVLLKNEVLEVRNFDGRLHVARKERKPDTPYDQYSPESPSPMTSSPMTENNDRVTDDARRARGGEGKFHALSPADRNDKCDAIVTFLTESWR